MAGWFQRNVEFWVEENKEKIKAAWGYKGGWEGWLQVELAMHFAKVCGNNIRVTREDNIYEGDKHDLRQQVDLALVHNADKCRYLVELKAESEIRGQDAFLHVVNQDLVKVNKATVKPEWRPCAHYVWVFFAHDETRTRGFDKMHRAAVENNAAATYFRVIDNIWAEYNEYVESLGPVGRGSTSEWHARRS